MSDGLVVPSAKIAGFTFTVDGNRQIPFPFSAPRPMQVEAVQETYELLKTEDFVVTCAPTGFGKSAFVIALANAIGTGYVITPQNGLIEQYRNDFGNLHYLGFLKSASHFKCIDSSGKKKNPEATCEDRAKACTCRSRELPPGQLRCPYQEARDDALRRPVVVLTAAMAATLGMYSPLLTERGVLIIDESQRIESTLIDAFTTELDEAEIKKDNWTFTNAQLPKTPEEIEAAKARGETLKRDPPLVFPAPEASEEEVVAYLRRWVRHAYLRATDILENVDAHEEQSVKEAKKYNNKISKILSILDYLYPPPVPTPASQPIVLLPASPTSTPPPPPPPPPPPEEKNGGWSEPVFSVKRVVLEEFSYGRTTVAHKIVCRPLAAMGLIRHIFGALAKKIVLVSATPGSPELVKDVVGLPHTPVYREYGAPFPKENRRIVYLPTAKLSAKAPQSDWDLVIDRIVDIAESDWHAASKGIIHSVSRKLHTQIVTAFRRKGRGARLVEVIGSSNRQLAIQQFIAKQEPVILIGPAITDGLDLKGDTCRWGILPKVPWPNLGDESVQYRNDVILDWYPYQTLLSIIQACGRNVRSVDDWGVNYILDASFGRLKNQYRRLFPGWFYDAIETIEES